MTTPVEALAVADAKAAVILRRALARPAPVEDPPAPELAVDEPAVKAS